MTKVSCLDTKGGKFFDRTFDSPYKARLFINKVRHSRTLILIGYTTDSQEENECMEGK